jgi:hypothetical protein
MGRRTVSSRRTMHVKNAPGNGRYDHVDSDHDQDGNVQVVRIVCTDKRHDRPPTLEQMEGGIVLEVVGEYGTSECLIRREWVFARGQRRIGDGGQPQYSTPRTTDPDGTVQPGGYALGSPRFACSCGDNVSVRWDRLLPILDRVSSAGVSELSLSGLRVVTST